MRISDWSSDVCSSDLRSGAGEGEFDRPNGVAVVDELLFVVERDNRRVQVLRLPGFSHVASFGNDEFEKPYGIWVNRTGNGYEVYVTDAYMADRKSTRLNSSH